MCEYEPQIQDQAAEEIGQLIGLGAEDVIRNLGGPWSAALYSDAADSLHIKFFIGRASDSVALLFDLNHRTLTVGKAVGVWIDLGLMAWDVREPKQSFELHSLSIDSVSEAADAAFRSKRRSLRICRYCGELLGLEQMFDETYCYGCASRYLGLVY